MNSYLMLALLSISLPFCIVGVLALTRLCWVRFRKWAGSVEAKAQIERIKERELVRTEATLEGAATTAAAITQTVVNAQLQFIQQQQTAQIELLSLLQPNTQVTIESNKDAIKSDDSKVEIFNPGSLLRKLTRIAN